MLDRIAVAVVILGLALGIPSHALADDQVDQTADTAHYQFELMIGPMETMVPLDQAATTTEGEVMLGMVSAMPADEGMPSMPMPAGQGNPDMSMNMGGDSMGDTSMGGMTGGVATHHVEVHVYDPATGAPVAGLAPAIALTNQTTGETIIMDQVMVMYGLAEGMDDLHYGNNVDLAPGTYTVTATVGDDVATFPDVEIG